jgi:hypothetical protein
MLEGNIMFLKEKAVADAWMAAAVALSFKRNALLKSVDASRWARDRAKDEALLSEESDIDAIELASRGASAPKGLL